jgi:nucleotide-binding universal stress UspA family protein
MMRRILVAIDGSEDALRALDFAVKVALFKPPAELHVLTVQAPADSSAAWEIYVTPERIHQVATERSRAILETAGKHLEGTGCTFVLESLEGEAAATIAARAAELECESIVMGTHGRGQLGILLLGSVAQRVVHHATVPVTLVK